MNSTIIYKQSLGKIFSGVALALLLAIPASSAKAAHGNHRSKVRYSKQFKKPKKAKFARGRGRYNHYKRKHYRDRYRRPWMRRRQVVNHSYRRSDLMALIRLIGQNW